MPKSAFLFPGQGAQTVGMAGDVCQKIPAAKKLFDEASAILGYDLLDVCVNGPKEKLDSTAISQPALFVAGLAALEMLRQSEPDAEASCIASAGLSLGEYTALAFAGAVSFADGVRLVQIRGEAMQAAADATPSGMVAVLGPPLDKVEEMCARASSAGLVKVANHLCPGNIVVSGTNAACEEIEKLGPEFNALKTVKLAVAGAFHTDIMKPADAKLAAALEKIAIGTPRIPVWSNVDAQPHQAGVEVKGLLVKQVIQPVLWEKCVRNMLAAGVNKFYELGPGRVLAGLIKRVDRKIEVVNVTV